MVSLLHLIKAIIENVHNKIIILPHSLPSFNLNIFTKICTSFFSAVVYFYMIEVCMLLKLGFPHESLYVVIRIFYICVCTILVLQLENASCCYFWWKHLRKRFLIYKKMIKRNPGEDPEIWQKKVYYKHFFFFFSISSFLSFLLIFSFSCIFCIY